MIKCFGCGNEYDSLLTHFKYSASCQIDRKKRTKELNKEKAQHVKVVQEKEEKETVGDGLKRIYNQKILPLEMDCMFHEFHSKALVDSDFKKPMILLVGQNPDTKKKFIGSFLAHDFTGILSERTIDDFMVVMYGDEEGVVPGNPLAVDGNKQFHALTRFGDAFLNHFQCSSLKNEVLSSVTIVDTPSILSGEKQRLDRGYDFSGVLEWFAESVDRIILLFDAHNLDISDEFKRCIEALSGNEDKIRIVLNKSDMVDHHQLMRVYGALMWKMGKVFKTPEVSQVHILSFSDEPLNYDINRRLFQDEQHDLFSELQSLPRNAALRKLNDLIKRARLAKAHAYIIAELQNGMPSRIGKEKKKKELIAEFNEIYEKLQREHNISPGDFPDVNKMRRHLETVDFGKFKGIIPARIYKVNAAIEIDLPRLIKKEEARQKEDDLAERETAPPAVQAHEDESFDKHPQETDWVVSDDSFAIEEQFRSLNPIDGKVNGLTVKKHMIKSKLPNSVLRDIWKSADIDKDCFMDEKCFCDGDQFASIVQQINRKLEDLELPTGSPTHDIS